MVNEAYPFYIVVKNKEGYYSCVSMYNKSTDALIDRWYEIQKKEIEIYGHPYMMLEEIVLIDDPKALPAATYPDRTIRILPSIEALMEEIKELNRKVSEKKALKAPLKGAKETKGDINGKHTYS